MADSETVPLPALARKGCPVACGYSLANMELSLAVMELEGSM